MKFSSIVLGVAAAGVIAASPAVAARLVSPTGTRSADSLPDDSVSLNSFSLAFTTSESTTRRRQSPILVTGDSSG